MQQAIFLDRDGTIIVDRVYLNDVSRIEYLPEAIEGLRQLRDLGFKLIVITNQSGLARGLVQIENLDAIHRKMTHDLARHGVQIAGYYHAPYSVESRHHRRKPLPGLLKEATFDHSLQLKGSWMIGDRWTDIEAGRALGLDTIWIDHQKGDPDVGRYPPPERTARNLVECAALIRAAQFGPINLR